MSTPRRILVYGVCGSGKTTFARRLSERTGIPWTSVDDLTWQPGWVEGPRDEQRRMIGEICAREAWILDTAYSHWLEVALARTELIVGLDFPRWLSFGRLLRRTALRLVDGRPICNGNRETLRTTFSRESILLWHGKSFANKRRRMRAWSTDPTGPTVRVFRTPAEAERWLRTLG